MNCADRPTNVTFVRIGNEFGKPRNQRRPKGQTWLTQAGHIFGVMLVLGGIAATSACSANKANAQPTQAQSVASAPKTPKALVVKVVNEFPHDATCFTEGLHFTPTVTGGGFYESCGGAGSSAIQLSSLDGNVQVRETVPGSAFAEGTVALGTRVYQLTWQERKIFVRDAKTLKILETRELPQPIFEGWGLTAFGSTLVVSDGTFKIHFLDPKTWKVTRSITVRNGDTPVTQINELEFVNGQLWANVWQTEQIIVIDTKSGAVTATISLAGLRPQETTSNPEAVPNGIAFDPKTKRIYVTGKLWAKIYQIVTTPA
jgi:glutaminyl-peptide cyclotransferase